MARNPIVFSNGTLVSNAKVNVGGTIYDVEPAQYEGTTPLSASNMNQLQTNLYDYVDSKVIDEYSESTTDAYSANYVNNLANKFKFTKTYTYNGTNMSTTNGAVRDYSSIIIHSNDDESVIFIEGTLYNNHSTAGGATVTFTTPLRPTKNVSMMNILTFYSSQQVGENMDILTNGTVSMGVYGTANGNSRHAIIPVLIFLD